MITSTHEMENADRGKSPDGYKKIYRFFFDLIKNDKPKSTKQTTNTVKGA